jgi:hypothetical protein
MFTSTKNTKYSLCLIPEFIEKTNCDCGKPADLMLNNEIYKCNKCISLLIPQNKLEINMDVSIPITAQTIKKMRFEWHGEKWDGEKWYNLWGNIIVTSKWNEFIQTVKSMIITKKEVEIDGEYSQGPLKRMTIY